VRSTHGRMEAPQHAHSGVCPARLVDANTVPNADNDTTEKRLSRQKLKLSDGLKPSTRSLPWRFRGGNGGHGRALVSTMCLQFGGSGVVGRDRPCSRVLGLVYPSRTRGLLSDHKTDNARTRRPLHLPSCPNAAAL
jgi:hypothetical protein